MDLLDNRLIRYAIYGFVSLLIVGMAPGQLVSSPAPLSLTVISLIAFGPVLIGVIMSELDHLMDQTHKPELERFLKRMLNTLRVIVVGINSGLVVSLLLTLLYWNRNMADTRVEPLATLTAASITLSEYLRRRYNADAALDDLDGHENEV